jgi:hypothetical protein
MVWKKSLLKGNATACHTDRFSEPCISNRRFANLNIGMIILLTRDSDFPKSDSFPKSDCFLRLWKVEVPEKPKFRFFSTFAT